MSGPLTIAVDGPAASGKSTIASDLARHFEVPFLDTGLLYRAVARRLIQSGAAEPDPALAVRIAAALEPADVEHGDLGSEALGAVASQVAVLQAVRAALLPFQRSFGTKRGAVLAGRDVGTVVLPDARFKLFVTATPEERARRRFEQLRMSRPGVIYAEVLEELIRRDRRDTERAVAPLRVAPDAQVLDTTMLDAGEAFSRARRCIEDGRRACA